MLSHKSSPVASCGVEHDDKLWAHSVKIVNSCVKCGFSKCTSLKYTENRSIVCVMFAVLMPILYGLDWLPGDGATHHV